MTTKVAEVKKVINENGQEKLAVRWEGKSDFNVIEDDRIAEYLIYLIIVGPKAAVDNQNSMCR